MRTGKSPSPDPGLRPLSPVRLPELLRLLGADPVPNVFLIHLARRSGLNPVRSGFAFFGDTDARGRLRGVCALGTTLLAWAPDPATPPLMSREALRRRHWRALLGDARSIDPVWGLLAPHCDPPAEDRTEQWHALRRADRTPARAASAVRRATEADVPRLLPLRCAMFEEPDRRSLTSQERERIGRRCRDGCREGHLFLVEENGRVLFTASFSAVTPEVTQISSVYTIPEARGRGIATAALAALCEHALRTSEQVSLFVAGSNAAALRVYGKLGFRPIATARSIRLRLEV